MFAKDVFWENKHWVKTKQVRFMIEMFQPISFSSMEKKNEEKLLKRKEKQGPDFSAGMRMQTYFFMGE